MSEMVKITRSKLESLSSAIRTKLGTDDTELTLAEMIVDIPELAKPKIAPGLYTKSTSGSYGARFIESDEKIQELIDSGALTLRKTWDEAIADGDLSVSEGYGTLMMKTSSSTYGQTTWQSPYYTVIIMDDSVKNIGYNAFKNYTNICGIRFSKNLEKITQYAFQSAHLPSQICLPPSLKTVENYAFQSVTTCTRVFYEGPAESTFQTWRPKNATLGKYSAMGT